MRTIIAAAFVVATIGLTAAAAADPVRKTVAIPVFSAIETQAGLDVDFVVGPPNVTIEGPSDEVARVRAVVKEGVLDLSRESRSGWFGVHLRGVKIHVTGPAALTGLKASSGADLSARGVSTTNFSVSASSGADIKVEGACASLVAHASSGASLDARGLVCDEATADSSSGADATIYARKRADGSASSGGGVVVLGTATIINRSESSGGDVTVRKSPQ